MEVGDPAGGGGWPERPYAQGGLAGASLRARIHKLVWAAQNAGRAESNGYALRATIGQRMEVHWNGSQGVPPMHFNTLSDRSP